MKKLLFALVVVLLCGVGHAQESVSLTTPTTKTASTQQVGYLGLDPINSRILVQLVANTGDVTLATYDASGLTVNGVLKAATPTGATLLHTLNTANFSINSLMKQVYSRLQTDGVIAAGTISGSAQ